MVVSALLSIIYREQPVRQEFSLLSVWESVCEALQCDVTSVRVDIHGADVCIFSDSVFSIGKKER